jgi:hypothetical protein
MPMIGNCLASLNAAVPQDTSSWNGLTDSQQSSPGSGPQFPWGLIDQSDACLGVTLDGNPKIRRFADFNLGDVLTRPPLKNFT